VGLHASCAEWMHEREVAVYGGDCIEKLPYPSRSMPSPLHVLALVAMGMPILDWQLWRSCRPRASAFADGVPAGHGPVAFARHGLAN
jgi:hypothetical protein